MIGGWPFVIAAYGLAIGGTLALAGWSIVALRRAEARAETITGR